jgi:hypothetical protein
MSYRERQRLAGIQAATEAIRSPLQRGDLTDGLIFDAEPVLAWRPGCSDMSLGR